MSAGVWYGVAAYVVWGLFPLYFKLIASVAAPEVIAHRIVWSFLTVLPLTLVLSRGTRHAVSGPVVLKYAAAALLIAVNWLAYVWGVASGFVVETSLGYFITPLVNVTLGVLVFGETLRPLQWVAVATAAAGVAYLTYAYGTLPWLSLALALSFGSYGLAKKKVSLDPLPGLTLETGILLLPAVVYLFALRADAGGVFLRGDTATDLLLVGAGMVTTVPLLLFASAVRRVTLTTIGLLQYIAPTMQFLLGVLVFREPFSRTQLTGFGIVWAALVLFSVEGVVARRRAWAERLPDGRVA